MTTAAINIWKAACERLRCILRANIDPVTLRHSAVVSEVVLCPINISLHKIPWRGWGEVDVRCRGCARERGQRAQTVSLLHFPVCSQQGSYRFCQFSRSLHQYPYFKWVYSDINVQVESWPFFFFSLSSTHQILTGELSAASLVF